MRAPQFGTNTYSVATLKRKGYRIRKSKMKPNEDGLRFSHFELARPDGTVVYSGGEKSKFDIAVRAELTRTKKGAE